MFRRHVNLNKFLDGIALPKPDQPCILSLRPWGRGCVVEKNDVINLFFKAVDHSPSLLDADTHTLVS